MDLGALNLIVGSAILVIKTLCGIDAIMETNVQEKTADSLIQRIRTTNSQ